MPNRFHLVNSVLDEALDCDAAERPQFLATRCGLDRELRASVERLLSIADVEGNFPDAPMAGIGIRPGDLLGGRFRILEELGIGGTSTVYRAEDRQFGEVALKIPHPEICGQSRVIERLRAEIQAARAVRHPNICPVYDLFVFESRVGRIAAATMPCLAGETLRACLSRGPIPSGEVIRIADGIAAGIDALHSAEIVHRDLKPENILLTQARNGWAIPVLMDFGLAVFPGTMASAATISGSPDYMAPEQFRGAPASPAIDIYTFGLVLFEMLAGARPFPPEELLPSVVRRSTEDAARLSAVAPWTARAWDAAIARALSRDPARRPASAMELIGEVRQELAEDGVRRIGTTCRCSHHSSGNGSTCISLSDRGESKNNRSMCSIVRKP